jgi:hypothetical protein
MSQKFYAWFLKIGILASLLVVYFVFSNFLFPFITSKQISFNVIMEVLLILWLALIIKYPQWSPFHSEPGKPLGSWITISLITFLAAITLSSIVGVDFNLSFWGDIERMLGVFHVLHFFALYLIIITVMRKWGDWSCYFGHHSIAVIEALVLISLWRDSLWHNRQHGLCFRHDF